MADPANCKHKRAHKVEDVETTKRDRLTGAVTKVKVGENWHCDECGTDWYKGSKK